MEESTVWRLWINITWDLIYLIWMLFENSHPTWRAWGIGIILLLSTIVNSWLFFHKTTE